MKFLKALMIVATVAVSFMLSACSDSTDPGNTGTVKMEARLSTTSVSAALLDEKVAHVLGAEVDSIALSRVRILVTRLKMQEKGGDDSTGNGDRDIRVGPMVIDATADSISVFATEPIPAGTYDKIKFEFHRFNASQIAEYLNDAIFGPFVVDDRWTVIVDGTVYESGTMHPFTYRSDITANLSLKFPNQIQVQDGETVTVIVEIDPLEIFKQGNGVLDPRDGSNESKIDNAIKSAIKALKK